MTITTRVLAAAAVLGAVSARALADEPPALDTLSRCLSPAPMPADPRPTKETTVFQPMYVDIAFLETLRAGEWFAINAAPTRTFAARVETVEHRGPGRFSLIGRVDGLEESLFTLVVEMDAVAGSVMSPGTREHYKLRYQPDGVHLVCAIDGTKFMPCGGADVAPPVVPGDPAFDPLPDPDDGLNLPEPAGGDDPFGDRGGCAAPQTVFDGMVAYSDNVRVAMGSTNAVLAEIQQTVDVTNASYSRSGIAARYRLVWRGEVNYSETGNSSTDLSQLRDPSDGVLDSLHTTRDSVNADVCTLWVDSLDACGRGYCTAGRADAFNVVQWGCAADNFSQPHEIGHNQGCDHNVEDGGGNCGAYSYSYGHRFFAGGNGYRTIMAYNNAAEDYTRIGYFSNPDVTFLGVATGSATHDNERTINNRRGTFEGLELTRMDIWVQVGFAGVQLGTFANPYAAVSTGIAAVDVPSAGASEDPNLYIKAGTSTYTGTITKQMWIRACGGTVNIGGNP